MVCDNGVNRTELITKPVQIPVKAAGCLVCHGSGQLQVRKESGESTTVVCRCRSQGQAGLVAK